VRGQVRTCSFSSCGVNTRAPSKDHRLMLAPHSPRDESFVALKIPGRHRRVAYRKLGEHNIPKEKAVAGRYEEAGPETQANEHTSATYSHMSCRNEAACAPSFSLPPSAGAPHTHAARQRTEAVIHPAAPLTEGRKEGRQEGRSAVDLLILTPV
jgi:hypothetical protein